MENSAQWFESTQTSFLSVRDNTMEVSLFVLEDCPCLVMFETSIEGLLERVNLIHQLIAVSAQFVG